MDGFHIYTFLNKDRFGRDWRMIPVASVEVYPICSHTSLSQFPPFRYFPNFSELWNHTLAIEYHVYIWQVSPQLSCGTCQIWMWLKEFNMYFCKIENFAHGEINEWSFRKTPPQLCMICQHKWPLCRHCINCDFILSFRWVNQRRRRTNLIKR